MGQRNLGVGQPILTCFKGVGFYSFGINGGGHKNNQ